MNGKSRNYERGFLLAQAYGRRLALTTKEKDGAIQFAALDK